jgi:ABC-type sugar transport system ATPase subunit
LPQDVAATAGRPAWLIVRPEHLSVAPGPLSNRLDAVVDDLVYAGAGTICRLRVGGTALSMQIPGEATALTLGARVSVGWDEADSVVLHDP